MAAENLGRLTIPKWHYKINSKLPKDKIIF